MEEAAWICVAEYCPPYLAFGRNDWALNYSVCEQSVNSVIFLYQHGVSIKRRRRCESAADLVHFSSSAIEATVPQCSTLHPLVTSKRCGNVGSSGPPALGHLHLWESTAVSAPRPKHASHSCLTHIPAKQCYLSAHRQHRPENILTIGGTVTLMVNASFDYTF